MSRVTAAIVAHNRFTVNARYVTPTTPITIAKTVACLRVRCPLGSGRSLVLFIRASTSTSTIWFNALLEEATMAMPSAA